MLHQDYILRQIEMAVQFLLKMILGRDRIDSTFEKEVLAGDGGDLLQQLLELVEQGRIDEAENILYDALDPTDLAALGAALVFYDTLNNLDDRKLDGAGFSREEVAEGICDLARIYGVDVYTLFFTDTLSPPDGATE